MNAQSKTTLSASYSAAAFVIL